MIIARATACRTRGSASSSLRRARRRSPASPRSGAAQRLDPELRCVAALLSPSTGIIDSHALMLAYQGDAEAAGAVVAFRAPVVSGHATNAGFELAVGGDQRAMLRCRLLVNAAGL